MNNKQVTHFADDATLAYITKLERELAEAKVLPSSLDYQLKRSKEARKSLCDAIDFLQKRERQLERELLEAKKDVIRLKQAADESFQHHQEARQQFREGTWHGKTTKDYMDSVFSYKESNNKDMFSLGYQWRDKPHRHVADLCEWVNALLDERTEAKKDTATEAKG